MIADRGAAPLEGDEAVDLPLLAGGALTVVGGRFHRAGRQRQHAREKQGEPEAPSRDPVPCSRHPTPPRQEPVQGVCHPHPCPSPVTSHPPSPGEGNRPPNTTLKGFSPSSPGVGGGRGREKRAGPMRINRGPTGRGRRVCLSRVTEIPLPKFWSGPESCDLLVLETAPESGPPAGFFRRSLLREHPRLR